MSSNRDLEGRIADFYVQEGLLRAPDRVLSAALATIETTKQRRVLGRLFGSVSWRFPDMSNYLKFAVAAVAVIAALGVGYALYSGRSPAPGGTLVPTASLAPSPTIGPSPSPTPVGSPLPALTETYTSDVHGITVSYPSDWSIETATEPWVTGEISPSSAFADVISESGSDTRFIALTSQYLDDKQPASWAVEFFNSRPCDAVDPYTIDGLSGYISECDGGAHAVVSTVPGGTSNRAHVILLETNGAPTADDLNWFKEILGTVALDPGAALVSSDPFGVPFTFRIPAGPAWDFGEVNESYFEVRVPEYFDAGHPGGVIAQVIGAGLEDPCDPESAELPIDPGPQPVIDYLGTIPGFTPVDGSPTTVDGLDAVQAMFPANTETPPCEAMVWATDTGPFAGIPLEVARRVIAVDVGGEHVVFATFGEETNPGMTALVDELTGSISFD